MNALLFSNILKNIYIKTDVFPFHDLKILIVFSNFSPAYVMYLILFNYFLIALL